MKYEPTPDTPLHVADLVSKIGGVLENRLKNNEELRDYNYIAIDSNGDVWAYSLKPLPRNIVWGLPELNSLALHLSIRISTPLVNKINRYSFKYMLYSIGGKNE